MHVTATLGTCLTNDPMLYAAPVALTASWAFMMPVATPPNAIVYASGLIHVPQRAKTGLLLNLLCILAITAAVYAASAWVLAAMQIT